MLATAMQPSRTDPTGTTVMPTSSTGRRLYIAHLTHRQAAMEDGRLAMDALSYRVLARQLRSALAGQALPQMRKGFVELPPELLPVFTEALEARHFDDHAKLFGPRAQHAKVMGEALMVRLALPTKSAR
jgi:hypothetical protein